MMSGDVVPGRCLCGAVRFEVELPSTWCAHCHCSMCRRAHGAGFVTWVGFERSRVRVLAGEELGQYRSSPPAKAELLPDVRQPAHVRVGALAG
jgi:hypothetical protein